MDVERATSAESRGYRPLLVAVSVLLVAPLAIALVAGASHEATGLTLLPAGLPNTVVSSLALALSAFLGPPLAVLMNLVAMSHVSLSRSRHERISGEIAMTFGVLQGIVVVLAVLLAVAFYGHLLADAFACANGVRSAC